MYTSNEIYSELLAARECMLHNPQMPRNEYSAAYERAQRLSRELGEAYWAEHPLPAAEFTSEDYAELPDSFEQSAINALPLLAAVEFLHHVR